VETFLNDYRQKVDQLEFLISNLTISEPLVTQKSEQEQEQDQDQDQDQDSSNDEKQNYYDKKTWRSLIDLRLKRAKRIISRLSSIASSKKPTTATTTVTKFLPTSILLLHF
jgi:hypothetical protein